MKTPILLFLLLLSMGAFGFENYRQAAAEGEKLFRAGKNAEAIALFRQAIPLAGNDQQKNNALFRIAEALHRMKKYDAVIAECTEGLKQPYILPADAGMFHFYIQRAMAGKNAPLDELVPHCRQVIALLPAHWVANSARITATELLSARKVRRFDEAIALNLLYLEKDEMTASAEFETYVSLCRLYLAKNQLSEAEKALAKAKALLEDDTIYSAAPGKFALVNGEVLRKRNNYDGAIAEFLKVPACPGLTRREISDSWNQAAEAAYAKKDYDTAKSYADKAVYPNSWLKGIIEEALQQKKKDDRGDRTMTQHLYIPVLFSIITEETRGQIADQLKQAKCDTILFSQTEFFGEGEKRRALLAKMRTMREYFEGQGFHVTIWLSTLGYAGKRNADFQRRFSDCVRIKNIAGVGTGDNVCLTDEKFSAFLIDYISDVAATGVSEILLDDDFTLSGRNAAVCTCENHLRAFGNKIGRTVTRKDVEQWFTGGANEMRTAYLKAQEESILAFCGKLRQEVDRRAGKNVCIGLCATYSGFDLESTKIEEIVRTLAGENLPILRCSGAPFWSRVAPRLFDGMALGSVVEFIRFQESFLRNSGIRCNYENDPWPRQRRLVPSAYMECYDKMLLTIGWLDRQKYLMRYSRELEFAENGYWEHHQQNLPDEEVIRRIFTGKTAVGLRVYNTRQITRQATLPEPYESDYVILSLVSQPRAGDFAFENSVPTAYEGNQPGIVFWEHARMLTDEQIRRGLILDRHAAQILTERGYDVGLRNATPLSAPPLSERFSFDPENTLRLEDPNGKFYQMEIAPEAEVQSYWRLPAKSNSSETAGAGNALPREPKIPECPACYTYQNAQGMRFAVYGFDSEKIRYSMPLVMPANIPVALLPGRERQLASLYSFLSGGTPLPVSCFKHPQLYILASRKDDRLAVMLCNVFPDPIIHPVLNLDNDYQVVDSTDSATLRICSQNRKMQLPTVIPAYHYLALELQVQ